MRPSGTRLLTAAIASVLIGTPALAACPARIGVGFGDTLASIAQACGISVERLRSVNPGLDAGTLRPGVFIAVPRPQLPSSMSGIGRPSVGIAPPLVPPATGVSPSSTVIAPPARPVVPRLHPLPGFDEPLGPGMPPRHVFPHR